MIKIRCRGFEGFLFEIQEVDSLYYNNGQTDILYNVILRFAGDPGYRHDIVQLERVTSDEIIFIKNGGNST